jgi:hypothetical protein
MRNRHPIDELADVREQKKILSSREEELRDMVIFGDVDLTGEEHFARLVESEQSRVDRGMLEARFGKAAVAECCKIVPVTTVRLVKRNIHGAE